MSENLKSLVLEFLQENGLKLRKDIPGLSNARLEENPVRLVLSVSHNIEKPDFNYKGTNIPVEIEVVEVKPVVVVDKKDGSGQEPETEMRQTKENDDIVHNEFSTQARDIYKMTDAINPHVGESDVKAKGDFKSEAYEAWKKRHNKVNVIKE